MVYEVRIQGVDQVARNLAAAGAFARQGQYELADEFGARVASAVRGRASGRPGPRIITGHYISTIDYLVQATANGAEAVVYSTAPQARRLELGFYGRDSLGRNYNQPPYPHFRPAFEQQYPFYVDAQYRLAARVAAVGNGGGAGGGGGGRAGALGRVVGVALQAAAGAVVGVIAGGASGQGGG